jgi:outer membrane protein assembly factor BamB
MVSPRTLIAGAVLALVACAARAQEAPIEVRRLDAAEARQGVAVDATHLYAIDNGRIARYDKATGVKQAEWSGEAARFPHLNSCLITGGELVCAGSNYSAIPQVSAVEIFDPARMTHKRTIALGMGIGSLTWIDRHDGFWWAMFANYDGKGGEPNRDHRWTTLIKFDDQWRRLEGYALPAQVLERMAPYSSSGGGFGDDGRLYVTGHDRAELYVLEIPKTGGATLDYVTTMSVPFEGQAITWDPAQHRVLWGINRATRQVVAVKVAPVADKPVAATAPR